jgi:uncharacterized protein (TIGR02246 family)
VQSLSAARFALTAALVACAPEGTQKETRTAEAARPAVDAEAEERTIRELDDKWVKALEAKDTAAVANFYAERAVFLPASDARVEGRDGIRSAWAEFLRLPKMSLTFSPTDIEISDNGDMAYDIGTYRLAFDGPKGRRIEEEGKYLQVWEKMGGQWQVVADMFNSDKPAQPAQ